MCVCAQTWGQVKKRSAAGLTYHVPLKPFVVAPRVPAEKRCNLLLEKQLLTLEEMGVEIMEDPGDAANSEQGADAYAAQIVEHARHAILKAQGLLQPQRLAPPVEVPSPPPPAAPKATAAKRKR